MKKPTLLFVLGFILVSVTAQEKLLTYEDAIYMNPNVYPSHIPQLQWIGKSENYAYANENAVYKVTAKRGTETMLFDLDLLNTGMLAGGYDSLKRMPRIHLYKDNACYFRSADTYFEYNFTEHTLQRLNQLPDRAENIEFNVSSGDLAFTIDNNLYFAQLGETRQITHETDRGIVCGQTVHRVEFGINKGIFWSPNGNRIAFYRKDETMVADYPLVDITKRIGTVENTKYPMAGETSEQVTVGVYDLANGSTVFMKTGKPKDQYLTSITWSPNEEFIFIGILNRDQNHLKLNKYDAVTGEFVNTLFEEMHPKYVEPETPVFFLPDNSGRFIWISERDGYNHLYLHAEDGAMLKQMTSGEWVVTEFLGFYGEDVAWFTGTIDGPLQNNIYSLHLITGEVNRISPDHGSHRAIISKSGKYIIDIFSSVDISREYKLLNRKGKTIRVIREDINPLSDYNMGEMSMITLKSEDGSDLYGRLIKPINFDNTKKYPAIIYVYGGPHSQLVTDSWLGGAGLFLNLLAQKGYVVFTLDNHGTSNRGLDFEQAIFRKLGEIEVKDQMVGVDYLKSLPYVDEERIGVDGWSYGGFMTISMMLKNPGVFKVGVAGGPVTDWKYYEVMYGERYMDTPQDNPEGYKNSSLVNKIDQLNGKLMIIHGTMDPTVVWQQSLVLLKEAISAKKQIDYFVFPGHGHNMRGIDRAYLYEKITEYFKANL